MIPESTFQRIREEADIVKIVSEYIKLEKKSSSYIGLCPFHPDQNPSLHVSPTKKIYKCFSCGASGDVIGFIQNYEKVPFPRAVQIAGEKCGISIQLANDENLQNLTKYYNILSSSANFYHFLLENTVDGEVAKKYLYKRNLNDEIIKRFNIGLAGDESDLLYKSLLEENFQPLDMIEAGVVRGTSNYTDVFRNRIMFPLDDINGKIVGFSGRVFRNIKKEEPKYLNSSENKVFKKGNILYNFSAAQNHIRHKDLVYVFEGFMDVIAAYKCDIHNTVATMGTSISQNHLKTIKKITNNIVLCYDGDSPGVEASKKAIMQFLKADFNVNAVLLPEGIDPDDYLNKYGEDKLADFLVNKQISGYNYLYEASKKNLNVNNLNSLEIFKNEIFNYLVYFNSNVLTERFMIKLSEDISVSVESLKLDFAKLSKQPDNIIEPVYEPEYENSGYDYLPELPDFTTATVVVEKQKHKKNKYINASKNLIKIAFNSKEFCNLIKQKLNDRFVDKTHNSLLVQIYNFYSKNNEMSPNGFKEGLSQNEVELLNDVLNSNFDIEFIKVDQGPIDEYVKQINQFYIEKQLEDLKAKMDSDESLKNLENINELKKLKKELTILKKNK